MYSIIQLAAIALFLVSFFVPTMWLWGHVTAVFLFFMASMSARNTNRQKEVLRELQRKTKSSEGDIPPKKARNNLLFAVGVFACLVLILIATQKEPDQLSHPFSSNSEKLPLSDKDPEDIETAYQTGLQALNAKKYTEAEKSFRQAALGGMGAAQFSLGNLYENGLGLPKDGIQACYWYRVAADNKNIDAEKALERLVKSKNGEHSTWEAENC